jgi:WXG100 family type VII secretion target
VPGFDAEPWEIASAAAVVREVGDELQLGLNRLDLDVERLLAAWHGPAGAAFAAGWSQWQAGAADVLVALDAMARLLDATGHGYEAAESANVGAFG